MAEPFDWMETPPHRGRANATQETRDDEVRRRASLYAELGYPQSVAKARLRANFLWEHERIDPPAILKRIPALVAESYARAGVDKKKR